ncbi:hypothetical protein Cci01nite_82610 [Catellatospora citrea]|uniref:Helicase ATP-binding domain-containing protein n=2 Tax=Catellatospora citrea TaxID=53366 RepID=A0A8J3P3T7_9ACTN|nr:hypothetical protein Cci01nite_82610 [Catellatospora citrea]
MGGATDVLNGDALCPECNLKKGGSPMAEATPDLREWQHEARERYQSRNGGVGQNFLVVATPGAGKTTFALQIAEDLMSQRVVTNVVVIVPTAHLKQQWSKAAHLRGIQLDDKFVNRNGAVGSDFDGVVATYQAVASEPLLWRRLCARPTLVIFDEIHHAGEGDNLAWGPALKQAFEPAARRLLLSGTPFRSDAKPIPFVEYHDGRAVHGYNYDYGMALADGGVVRPAVFPAMDGRSVWRRAGEFEETSISLAETDEKTVPPALRAALDPTKDWIPSVLLEANNALSLAREDTPDAAGLVVASDQNAARAYAAILERITGERPAVAVSDEPAASDLITAFEKATSRWIVAVQMVAEGVDIPRLAVGVFATRVRTQMYFIQVVGRFVRMRGLDDETTARVFIPSIEPLLSYARDIEKTVDAVLADQEKRVRDLQESGEEFGEPPAPFREIEVIGSSAATHHATIASGTSITTEEKLRAEALLSRAGTAIAKHTTPETVALILRMAGQDSPLPSPRQSEPTTVPLSTRKQELKGLIHRKVGKLSYATSRPHNHIHGDMNRQLNNTITTAPLDSLRKRLEMLDRWLEEAS